MDEKNELENELSLDDVFVNLRLIAKIQGGDKLIQYDKYFNIDNSYFRSISRWFNGNNRKTNLEFINAILKRAFYFSENSDNIEMLLRLTNDLKNSIEGLNNLKRTYNNDKLVQSEIDLMIDNIRLGIDNSAKKLNFT